LWDDRRRNTWNQFRYWRLNLKRRIEQTTPWTFQLMNRRWLLANSTRCVFCNLVRSMK
jgi:hypothetical protein